MNHYKQRIICWLGLLVVLLLLSSLQSLRPVLSSNSTLHILYEFCAVGFWGSYLLDYFDDTTRFSRLKAAYVFFGYLGGLVVVTHSSYWHWTPSPLTEEFLGVTLGFWGEVLLDFLYNYYPFIL